jgi:hypothetical protein
MADDPLVGDKLRDLVEPPASICPALRSWLAASTTRRIAGRDPHIRLLHVPLRATVLLPPSYPFAGPLLGSNPPKLAAQHHAGGAGIAVSRSNSPSWGRCVKPQDMVDETDSGHALHPALEVRGAPGDRRRGAEPRGARRSRHVSRASENCRSIAIENCRSMGRVSRRSGRLRLVL